MMTFWQIVIFGVVASAVSMWLSYMLEKPQPRTPE